MQIIKLPNPSLLIFGAIGAFWIADIIHPGFNPVGIMILLLVPVLIIEFLYPQQELDDLLEQPEPIPAEKPVTGELVDNKSPAEG